MVSDTKKDLAKIKELELNQAARNSAEDTLLPALHLVPPAGWLNDPNGLCEIGGVHHIFFQYSPYEAKGGDKYWGHYETTDFVNFRYDGVFLSPDTPDDKDGVYSGSAYTEDGVMYLYYTGNVKEDGNYDYVYEGRGSNTILVECRDGMTPSVKRTVMTSSDYPYRLSCHVRDPKVWREGDRYYMVLGARTKNDKGTVLLYESTDKLHWSFIRHIETSDKFGYMWECPDLFDLSGHKFLSISPQGVKSEPFRYQNVYQSGYLPIGPGMTVRSEDFIEWDMGFDFYAPQTYLDARGRRILIGWMGVPDAEYNHDPSIEKGWQHMLTLPRELSFDDTTGRIRQWPIDEINALRCSELKDTARLPKAYELSAMITSERDVSICFDRDLKLSYESKEQLLSLTFTDCGYGRSARFVKMEEKLHDLRIIVDECCLEIYVNHGNYVLTTKYFYDKSASKSRELTVSDGIDLTLYDLKHIVVSADC